LLHDKDNDLANHAAKILARIGRPAIPELTKALKDDNAKIRHRAAWALSFFGPEARDAVPALAEALGDKNAEVRYLAALTLTEVGPAAEPACAALVKVLADPEVKVQLQAVQALHKLGAAAVPPLCEALGDERAHVRLGAAQVLSLLGPEAKAAVPQLRKALKEEDRQMRVTALTALGHIGPAAAEALPDILEALQILHLETQIQAYLACLQIAAENQAKLAETLQKISVKTGWALPTGLQDRSLQLTAAITQLVKGLQLDPDPQGRMLAAMGLAQLATRYPVDFRGVANDLGVATALYRALDDSSPRVRLAALTALRQMDPSQAGRLRKAMQLGLFQANDLAQAAQARLMALNGGRPGFNPNALNDPVLQGLYDNVVNLFIAASALYQCNLEECDAEPVVASLRDTVNGLPPEAVPALCKGLNKTAKYGIGFT
jgi:HEAT repeat protein